MVSDGLEGTGRPREWMGLEKSPTGSVKPEPSEEEGDFYIKGARTKPAT